LKEPEDELRRRFFEMAEKFYQVCESDSVKEVQIEHWQNFMRIKAERAAARLAVQRERDEKTRSDEAGDERTLRKGTGLKHETN